MVTKVLGGFFVSSLEVSATLMGPIESSRIRSSLAFIRKLSETFCLYTESFRRRFFLTIIAISWYQSVNNTTSENRS